VKGRPRERVAAVLWRAGFTPDQFVDWCELAESEGVLYDGPDAFLAAVDEGECWMIYVAAGSVAKMLSLAPYPRPRIAFHRALRDPERRRREYSWDRLAKILNHHGRRRRKETEGGGDGGSAGLPGSGTSHGDVG
jgi:hypothetical protein